MKKKAQPKSGLLAAIHESMTDAHEAGLIDGRRMKEFDAMCLDGAPREPVIVATGGGAEGAGTRGK